MKALSEKHMVVVTALALGLIIFWLIASDPQATTASTSSPTINNSPDVVATVTAAQSSD